MSDTTVSFDQAASARASSDDRRNARSTIEFPYLDLDAAVDVARAVYNRAGRSPCEIDELAAQMGQTVSGAFRLKIATTRLFGLIEKEGSRSFRLSPIGQRVVQGDTEAEARADAFLAVPLYRAIFDQYRGHLLPPTKALEREMVTLGVAPKQADKARQAFERSARQAGFFAHGEDRLVQPRFDRGPETRRVDPPPSDRTPDPKRKGGGSGDGDDPIPPVRLEYQLVDLLKRKGIGDEERKAIWTLVQFLSCEQPEDQTHSNDRATE